MLRDVLTRKETLLFRPGEFYILAAAIGMAVFLGLIEWQQLPASRRRLWSIATTFSSAWPRSGSTGRREPPRRCSAGGRRLHAVGSQRKQALGTTRAGILRGVVDGIAHSGRPGGFRQADHGRRDQPVAGRIVAARLGRRAGLVEVKRHLLSDGRKTSRATRPRSR